MENGQCELMASLTCPLVREDFQELCMEFKDSDELLGLSEVRTLEIEESDDGLSGSALLLLIGDSFTLDDSSFPMQKVNGKWLCGSRDNCEVVL
jgi:hypothetical protein